MSTAIKWQNAWDALQLAKKAEQQAYNEHMKELARIRPRNHFRLTPREIEVLQAVCDNLQNKEIAERLNISDRTAKFYVSKLLIQLNALNRQQLRRIVDESPEVFSSIGIRVTSDTIRVRAIA